MLKVWGNAACKALLSSQKTKHLLQKYNNLPILNKRLFYSLLLN